MNSELSPAVVRDRYLFLRALQNDAPIFWEGFRDCCYANGIPIEAWAERAGVVDEWLKQVLHDTLGHWLLSADVGGAKLEPGWEWFVYGENVDVEPFDPVFEEAYPKFSGVMTDDPLPTVSPDRLERIRASQSAEGIEMPDEFRRRMRAQFDVQLKAYTDKWLRHVSNRGDPRSERMKHAEWTALVFGRRATCIEIAERWPDLERVRDPEATVRKAVQRFAGDIGLTLPKPDKNLS